MDAECNTTVCNARDASLPFRKPLVKRIWRPRAAKRCRPCRHNGQGHPGRAWESPFRWGYTGLFPPGCIQTRYPVCGSVPADGGQSIRQPPEFQPPAGNLPKHRADSKPRGIRPGSSAVRLPDRSNGLRGEMQGVSWACHSSEVSRCSWKARRMRSTVSITLARAVPKFRRTNPSPPCPKALPLLKATRPCSRKKV